MGNDNAQLIDGLQKLVDFLKSKPDMPDLGEITINVYTWDDKDMLKAIARQLGSFTKTFEGDYLELNKPMNDAVKLRITARLELFCKKVVTCDCPDDGLLELMDEAHGEPEKLSLVGEELPPK